MQADIVQHLRELVVQEPASAQRVHLVELRELVQVLGPRCQAATLLRAAAEMANPQIYRVGVSRQWFVLLDAEADDTVVIRPWW